MRQRFTSFRGRVLRLRTGAEAPSEGSEGSEGPRRPVLVVGLGNPGAQYGNTRHNVGAWCVQLLARRHGARLGRHGKLDGATIEVGGRSLHLARPRAMMNESGPPVAAELRRLRLRTEQLLVVYDEIDLPVGQMRIRPHGGDGGHRGMRSILGAVGGNGFARIRIGIDRPYDDGRPVRDPDRIADWVLSEPGPDERRQLDEAVALAAETIEAAVIEGLDTAMNTFNRR